MGLDKFDLLSAECPPECDDPAATCSSNDSEASDHCPVESLSTITVPQFDQVLHVHDPVNKVPATLQHLHQLMSDICTLEVGLLTSYANLRAILPILSTNVAPRTHVDGGSIATTTDHKDYLFSFQTFSPDKICNSVIHLKVANDSIHVSSGVGYVSYWRDYQSERQPNQGPWLGPPLPACTPGYGPLSNQFPNRLRVTCLSPYARTGTI